MLLKHKTNKSKFIKRNQGSKERETAELRENELTGKYIPKEKRLEKKKELQKAHFKLAYNESSEKK